MINPALAESASGGSCVRRLLRSTVNPALAVSLAIEVRDKSGFSRISILRQLSTFGSEDSRRIDPSKNQHPQLLREHCPAAAEYVWLGRFTENRSQQKSALTVAQGALSCGS